MPLIHRIEDLQFVCFALIFGVMAFQSRQERTIRYVWCSYLLAAVVAVVDSFVAQPLTLFTNSCILTLLSLRYAVLAAGIASFTGRARWLAVACFGMVAVTSSMLLLGRTGLRPPVVFSLYFVALAMQLLLICVILLRSREVSTRVPRWLLAGLFLISAAYRGVQMMFALSQKTPHDVWIRDQALFLNSTILGSLLPFTIMWMMNARDHANLLKQSLIDPLTNLLNRRGLADEAYRELTRYLRERRNFAVAVADIDHFKALNDTYGHAFGDRVLARTARLLTEEVRQTDIVARTGGEEFVILLPLTDELEMATVLERVRHSLEQQIFRTESGATTGITISIGMTNTHGRMGLTWADLQNEADAALYEAKQRGRNRVVQAAIAEPIPA